MSADIIVKLLWLRIEKASFAGSRDRFTRIGIYTQKFAAFGIHLHAADAYAAILHGIGEQELRLPYDMPFVRLYHYQFARRAAEHQIKVASGACAGHIFPAIKALNGGMRYKLRLILAYFERKATNY